VRDTRVIIQWDDSAPVRMKHQTAEAVGEGERDHVAEAHRW
jgi:hypothetical protein